MTALTSSKAFICLLLHNTEVYLICLCL